MPKEKICDCGKPESQCECEGHNHKKAKNVKKGGVPDYLSIFGDRVQQYADYKRKKQEQYTPRSLYDPFGIVVDIGDDGGLSGTASFYKPGKSRGTAMTKKSKVQMCEDCGKPEFACKCKGHQGGRSMSKANGPSLPPPSLEGPPPRDRRYKGNVSSASDYVNYLFGNRIDPLRPFGYSVGGPNEREYNNAMISRSYSDDALFPQYDPFPSYTKQPYSYTNTNTSTPQKVPNVADVSMLNYINQPRATSSNSSQQIKQDAWTPEYITNRVNAPTNSRRRKSFEAINRATRPFPPNAEMYTMADALSGVVDELSNQLDRYGRFITANTYNNTTGKPRSQVTPKYVLNQVLGPQYDYDNTTGKPRSQVTPDYVWNQVLGSQYDYDNTTGKPRSQVTPDYYRNVPTPTPKNIGKSMKESKSAKMPKRKVEMCEDCGKPEFACKCKGHQGGRSMSKAMCKCGSGMSKAMCKCGGMGKRMAKGRGFPPVPPPSPIKNLGDDIKGTIMTFSGKMPGKMKDMLGLGNLTDIFRGSPMKLFSRMGKRGNKVSKANVPPPPPLPDISDIFRSMSRENQKRGTSYNALPLLEQRRYNDPLQNQRIYDDGTPDYINYLYPNSSKMNKRGNKVSKAWPWSSDFEDNGGDVRPQRRRGGINPEFGFEPKQGYNPAENAVRQMMPTKADIAMYNSDKMFNDLMDAYTTQINETIRNPVWQQRQYDRLDRAGKAVGDPIVAMFQKPKLGVPRGMNKRLSKSMKMDADMAKTPQKITPKRTIRHTDKYFK